MAEIITLVLLTLLNGILSGAEIAVLSMRRSRVQTLVESGSRRAKAILALRNQPERFLATVQIGITVVGATAAAFGGTTFKDALAQWVAASPLLAIYAEQIALGLVRKNVVAQGNAHVREAQRLVPPGVKIPLVDFA